VSGGEVAGRRRHMGEALAGWSSVSGCVHSVDAGSWVYLSGLPSPDVNMALVDGSDRSVLEDVVDRVDSVGAPTLVFFAGDGLPLARTMGDGWSHAGAAPFMTTTIASAPQLLDSRVRRATAEDRSAVVGLWTDAFGIPVEAIAPIFDAMLADPHDPMSAWLLEHDGEAVSTVTTGRVGDAVTLWCMATPERFGRRGYARALLADTMARAASDGAEVGLLGATPAGKPLYDATGWTTLEDWEIYTNGDSAQYH